VGFHGYGEDAEIQLERLRAIPDSDRWLCVSIQALHRFYQKRTERVVASWMTRQDREAAIGDNVAYVANCINAVAAEWPATRNIVFAGFSQGVAMAYRAAVHSARTVAGVIAVGGDLPPELTPGELKCVSAALLARGTSDGWYSKKNTLKTHSACGIAPWRFARSSSAADTSGRAKSSPPPVNFFATAAPDLSAPRRYSLAFSFDRFSSINVLMSSDSASSFVHCS